MEGPARPGCFALAKMHAIVSIHDVTPKTLVDIDRVIARLPAACHENLILLIVPGAGWRQEDVDKLRDWQQRGMILAGHGWTHEAREIATLYHRLHSLLLSRHAAEHLALDEREIAELLECSHGWFAEQGLDAPELYVPPAWALGAVGEAVLRASSWRYIEVLTGILDVNAGVSRVLPLTGFEADAWHRQILLAASNRINRWLGTESRPVRIAIHPYDFDYRLAIGLESILHHVTRNVRVESIFD